MALGLGGAPENFFGCDLVQVGFPEPIYCLAASEKRIYIDIYIGSCFAVWRKIKLREISQQEINFFCCEIKFFS